MRRRIRLQWIGFAGVAIAIGLFMGMERFDTFRAVERGEKARMRTLARVVEANLGMHVDAIHAILRDVRDRYLRAPMPDAVRAARLSDEMKLLVDSTVGARTMALMDAAGVFVASNRPELVGGDFSQRAYFQSARAARDPDLMIVSEPFTTVLNVYSLQLVLPILGRDGEFRGAVSISLDPSAFEQILAATLYADDLRCLLIHESGVVFESIGDIRVPSGTNLLRPGSILESHRPAGWSRPRSTPARRPPATGASACCAT